MAEQHPSSDNDNECSVAQQTNKFIYLYEKCTSLWDPKDKNYTNTTKRNEDLEKLVHIYKKIKPRATKDDVRKKINILRTTYRKDLRKIEKSKISGADEVYKPTNSIFHLLKFLSTIEKPNLKSEIDPLEDAVRSEDDHYLVISSITDESPPKKIRKKSSAQQNELPNRFCSQCSGLSQPSVSSQQDIHPLALIWTDKLNCLKPIQKLFAEKAINDILFEAQFDNLHRHSVQINAFAGKLSPATSASYTED